MSGGSQQVNFSCSESFFRKRNRAFLRSAAYQEANHIWKVGNNFGLWSSHNKYDVIQKLVELEDRVRT